MITFERENGRFTLRVAGVLVHAGRVLLHHGPQEEFWTLPGGRCELHEPTSEALIREMREELEIEVHADRLLWVVENFFEYDSRTCHEIGFYYLMSVPADSPLLDWGDEFVGDEFGTPLFFKWHQVDTLDTLALYPTFLKSSIQHLPHDMRHIVHRDEK